MMPLCFSNKGLPEAIEELLSESTHLFCKPVFYNEGFEERPDSNREPFFSRVIQEWPIR